jgi:hypothetical protein
MGRLALEPMHVSARMINFPGLSLQEEHLLSLPVSSRIRHLGETGCDTRTDELRRLYSPKVVIHYISVFSIIYVTYKCSKEIKLNAVPDSCITLLI